MPFHRPIPDSQKQQGKSAGGIKSLVEAEKLMQIAVLLPLSAFLGWLLGAWLNHLLNQSWLPLAGILFGGILGLIYVVRLGMSNTSSRPGAKDDSNKQ